MAEKVAYISNELQLLNHSLSFIFRNYSPPSAASILSRSPMTYNSTASLEKLTFTNFVDFGKCQDRFGQFFQTKFDPNYLDVKHKVFKKEDNEEFLLVQNLSIGEVDSNEFMRLRNKLVIAAENIAREENLSPVLIPTMSKNMDDQLKLAQNVVDVAERVDRKFCVTLLLYNLDKPDSSLCSSSIVFEENGGREV